MRKLVPDEVTAAAIKRLRSDSDFEHVTDWLSRALQEQDQANRPMIDSVALRQGQGAAVVLAQLIDAFTGKASKGVVADTRTGRPPQSDTAGGTSS